MSKDYLELVKLLTRDIDIDFVESKIQCDGIVLRDVPADGMLIPMECDSPAIRIVEVLPSKGEGLALFLCSEHSAALKAAVKTSLSPDTSNVSSMIH